METVRAISSMALAEAAGIDGTRSPGAAALRKRAPEFDIAVNQAIAISDMNRLNPANDQATQFRLASAVDRQITGISEGLQDSSRLTANILNDFMMQETAARRLMDQGQPDPLARLTSNESSRETLEPATILSRQRISPSIALNSASKEDLSAIAAGQYDRIASPHAREAVSMSLGLSNKQMATPSQNIADAKPRPVRDFRNFPSTGLGKGPERPAPPIFGRKVSAER